MVWSKIATLQTSYSYEQIYSASTTAKNWHMEQIDWICDLLESECGFTKTAHPDYGNTTSRRAYVMETPQFTDIRSGAFTSWYWWVFFSNTNFNSTTYDPWSYYITEGGVDGAPPTNPGTSSTNKARQYYATDAGDRYATGVLTAWKSSLDPSALLILTGNPYQIFYWPGPQQAYRPYATDPEPWKYQGALLPWGQYGQMSAGNPPGHAGTSYYGTDSRPKAFIDAYRGSTGASADRPDPASVAQGNLLYQDYWMVHGYTEQAVYQASRDCAVYRAAPSFGGLPGWTGQSSTAYKYYRNVYTYQVDADYWIANQNGFWFNAGPTLPDFGTSPWIVT